ncbi:MAG: hypothetical protein KAH97_04445 [Anaerolineales bacterium]|nr:hypothetical protein [Anaerolineales bacterium]
MLCTIQEERLWFVRNLALGLVSYLGVTEPPVFVENLLKYPPKALASPQDQDEINTGVWRNILTNSSYHDEDFVIPADLPLDEKRYAIAREFILAAGNTQHGRMMGLAEFLDGHYREVQDYFARILLAPDHLVRAYRKRGGQYEDFAETFIIPTRIAEIRWEEPLSPSSFEVA